MIDTSKYEGHTEGPWHFCLGYDIKSDTYTGINPLKGGGDRVNGPVILSEYQFAKGTHWQRADMRLIEDAPLLLAEVNRLREWENRIRTYFGDEEMMDFYDWMKEKYGDDEE